MTKSSRRALRIALSLVAATAIAPSAASAAGQTFTTHGEHAFVVPVGVRTVQVTLVGGHGGPGSTNGNGTGQAQGGRGATVRATIAVTPGETLYAQVAGNGQKGGARGYGGGGLGGPVVALLGSAPGGGGGGGASVVRRCPAAVPASCSPLVVAGGGGGGGGTGRDTTPTITGGDGGAAHQHGYDGEPDLSMHDAGGGGGKAGGQTAGGAAGANSYQTPATAGQLSVGGNGGTSIGGGGGGGGGGLYGGGGGGAGNGYADFATLKFFSGAGGGGGGGSSGIPAGAAGVSDYSLLPTADGSLPSAGFSWTLPPPSATTEAAGAVTSTTATLAGTVNTNLSALTDCHFALVPAPPSGSSVPCAQQLETGDASVPVSGTVAGLVPATSYTVTLIAANPHGTTSGGAVTFTTAAAEPLDAPRVSGLKLSRSRFRSGRRRARLARLRVGTTVTFQLSAVADVRLTFKRATPGRRVRNRCLRPTPARRRGAPCTRHRPIPGAVRLAAPEGTNRIRFDGVLDGGRSLRPGTYRLSLVALGPAGRPSPAQHARFKIFR